MSRVLPFRRPTGPIPESGPVQHARYVSPLETLEHVKGRIRSGVSIAQAVMRERVKRGQPPGCNDPHWSTVTELALSWELTGRPSIVHPSRDGGGS